MILIRGINMENTTTKESFKHKIKNAWNAFWNIKWYPFLTLLVLFAIVLIIVFIYTNDRGGFLHMNSDDLIQYYPYVSGFFDKIKQGNVSLYDTSLFGGVSFFSAAYYIPLDIFTFIAFLLSFFIENETAYAIMNFMRPVCGALLLYYVFARKFNTKVAFLCALILFCGGTTESYYIFPVYLGICFYAPLGMLLIDLCIEKKGYYYLLLPIYSIIVILYDFYIAYMLLAFTSIYFVATMFASLGNSSDSHNKRTLEFFKRFFEYLLFILLGVVIGAFFLMPSALYIMHQTSRNGTSLKDILYSLFNKNPSIESYWYFNNEHGTIVDFSWRHYFTQWMNLFIPNDPHQLCLVEPGDYIREHATMYITCGGFIYLIYFFFQRGKYENRLKFFVLLMNLLLCIPLFCVIFGFNTAPYLRWFFIPYFLNLYAAAIAMNQTNLKATGSKVGLYITILMIALGLISMVYVLMLSPSVFIHYKNVGDYFYLLLIPSLVAISLYLLILLITLSFKLRGKDFLHGRAIPILIFLEFIFATIIIFANVDNTSARYYTAKETNETRLNTMKEIYNYDKKNGYRTNLYTIFGRETTNLNILEGDVNFGRFFQSFYNTPLNTVLKSYYDESSNSWSRSFNGGYSLISGPIFNTKYIISNENIHLPLNYYHEVIKENTKYYELKDDIPFIVYDEFMASQTSFNSIQKQASILHYGYIEDFDAVENLGIKETPSSDIRAKFNNTYTNGYLSFVKETDNHYYIYDLSKLSSTYKNYDAYMIMPATEVRRLTHGFMYLTNEIPTTTDYTNLTQLHYNTYYGNDLCNYKYLLVENNTKNTVTSTRIYGYKYSIYDDFITKQNSYTNKEFVLDGSKMNIKVTMPEDTSVKVIKTGYTYSSEWEINQAFDSNNNPIDFKTINIDGGFLGIVVPKGVLNVDITLNFMPEGFNTGLKISAVGCIIYAGILIPTLFVFISKKKKRVTE